MSESRYFHVNDKGQLTPSGSLVEAILAANAGGYIWIDLSHPAPDELKQLRDPLGLNPLALADWDHPGLPARLEHFTRNSFLRLGYLGSDGLPAHVVCFTAEKLLLTLSPQASPFANFTPQAAAGAGPGWLLQSLCATLLDKTTNAQELAAVDQSEYDPAAITAARVSLLSAARVLGQTAEVLLRLSRKESPFVPEAATAGFISLSGQASGLQTRAEDMAERLNGKHFAALAAGQFQTIQAASASERRFKQILLLSTVVMPIIVLGAINIALIFPYLGLSLAVPWQAIFAGLSVTVILAGWLVYSRFTRGDR